jgi:hypothetical protein
MRLHYSVHIGIRPGEAEDSYWRLVPGEEVVVWLGIFLEPTGTLRYHVSFGVVAVNIG